MNNMNNEKVIIKVLDGYVLNRGDLSWDGFKALGECTIFQRTAPEDVLRNAADAQIVITNKTLLMEKELRALPKLRYIGVLATGYNVVDIRVAKELGIVVTNIPAYSTASVAQMVFAQLLTVTQRVEYYADRNREGKWCRSEDFNYVDTDLTELDKKVMGIVGLGNIGRATARIAQAFGMEVVAYTSKPQEQLPAGIRKVGMDELFATADVVTLHCPLNAETRYLVNARRLALMKSTAILINTGRGDLVNEQDLADALNRGQIRAAAVDVLSCEPPKADNPLLSADNCFVTPHIAWATREARVRLMNIAVENLRSYLCGHTINNVAL